MRNAGAGAVMRRTLGEIQEIVRGRWMAPPDRVALAGVATGVSIDSRTLRVGDLFLALDGARVDGRDYADAAIDAGAAAVLAEARAGWGCARADRVLIVDNAVVALRTLALDHRAGITRTTVIGVTGSVGKTTTCRLLDAALASRLRGRCSPRSYNNHLGVPLTILSAEADDGYLICEAGASAPGEMAEHAALIRPDVALITGVGRAHLEGFATVDRAAREKAALGLAAPAPGAVFVAEGSPALDAALESARAEVIRVGLSDCAHVRIESASHEWSDSLNGHDRTRVRNNVRDARSTEKKSLCGGRSQDGVGLRVRLADGAEFVAPVAGRRLAMNVALAVSAARRLGLADEDIRAGLRGAAFPPMRFERSVIGAVEVFNDAYNANPESVASAIETFAELAELAANPAARPGARQIIVLGDMLELGRAEAAAHEEALGRALAAGVDRVIALGPRFARAAQSRPDDRLLALDGASDEAIDRATGEIKPGDSVLLKGSRGMRLERVARTLERIHAGPARAPTL